MEVQAEKNEIKKHLVFRVGDRVLALPLINIFEIVTDFNIEPVPNSKDYISGLINIRGQIIKVMDLNYMFSKKYTEYRARQTSIVVIETANNNVGILVDDVLRVGNFLIEEIKSIPKSMNDRMSNLIEKVYKSNKSEMCFILSLDKILTVEDDLKGESE